VGDAGEVHAVAADCFVVIAGSSGPVGALHAPVPLELLAVGLRATRRLVPPDPIIGYERRGVPRQA
jgi:hypothetical protein